jgi:predicted GNAT superfamily acetyltransferase
VLGMPHAPGAAPRPAHWESSQLRVAVPADVGVLLREAPERARAWREATREAFTGALARGYRIEGFRRASAPEAGGGAGGDAAVAHYLLSR